MSKNLLKKLKFKKVDFKKLKPKKKMSKKKIVFLVIVAGVIVTGIYKVTHKAEVIPMVKCISLEKTNLVKSINIIGSVKSNQSIDVYAGTNSKVIEVKVKNGDKVSKGDVLAILDSQELEAQVKILENEITKMNESSKRDLESKKKAYDNAVYLRDNNMNSSILNAKSSIDSLNLDLQNKTQVYEYNKAMYSNGEISKQELDKSEIDYKNTKAAFDKANIELENVKMKVDEEITNLKNNYEIANLSDSASAKQLELEKLKEQIQDCEVKSPMDGVITYVNAHESTVPNGSLFTVENLDDLVISLPTKEVDICSVKVGQKVEIKTDSLGEESVSGQVYNVAETISKSPKVSLSSSGTSTATDTFETLVKLDNKDERVKSGMSARSKVILEEKPNIYEVPYESLVNAEDGKNYIYVVNDENGQSIIDRIEVTLGTETDIGVEINSEELKDNLSIVSDSSTCSLGENVQVAGNDVPAGIEAE